VSRFSTINNATLPHQNGNQRTVPERCVERKGGRMNSPTSYKCQSRDRCREKLQGISASIYQPKFVSNSF
jgi:hypothetical protein